MNPLLFSRMIFCFVTCYAFSIVYSYGQCPDNVTPQYMSFDTTVTGGGNDFYEFTFRKFDPSLGTLVAVSLETYVTLQYSFQLENHNTTGSPHTVRVTRTDEIIYPGGQEEKTNRKNFGPYALAGSDGIPESGLDYISAGPMYAFKRLYNVYNFNSNLASFLGNDTVVINYNTNSLANSVSNINSTLRGTAQDTIAFKVTYTYCQTTFLAADISHLTVSRLSSGYLQLNWFVPNDLAGNKYEIEKSLDTRQYKVISTITSTSNNAGNYQITYLPVTSDKNKLFFRIRQLEPDGSVKYSQVKAIDLINKEATPVRVYPAIATSFIKIFLPVSGNDDWQINIISSGGQIVQQQAVYHTKFTKLVFNRPLSPGLYIVEAINKRTRESQRSKIMIQR